jgi:hypothetical protein
MPDETTRHVPMTQTQRDNIARGTCDDAPCGHVSCECIGLRELVAEYDAADPPGTARIHADDVAVAVWCLDHLLAPTTRTTSTLGGPTPHETLARLRAALENPS